MLSLKSWNFRVRMNESVIPHSHVRSGLSPIVNAFMHLSYTNSLKRILTSVYDNYVWACTVVNDEFCFPSVIKTFLLMVP